MGCFNKMYEKMKIQLSRFQSEEEESLDTKCIYCTRQVRVRSFTQLSRGDHIMQKGDNFRVNIGYKQLAPYTHHAIVKDVILMSESEAELVLVEFISTPYDSEIKIRETKTTRTLYNDDIFIIKYQHETHSPDEIIRRADLFVEQSKNTDSSMKYSLLVCNCEHFCHWCCIGNQNSYQVSGLVEAIKSILAGSANVGGKILRVVLKLALLSAEDITKISTNCMLYLPWGVLSILGLIYFIYCIFWHKKLNKEKRQGNICHSCCCRLKIDMWSKFLVYAATNAGGLGLMSILMAAISSKGIVSAGLLLVSILSIGSMWLIPKLRNMLCSPFRGRKVKVWSMKKIWYGDIISFRYRGFMHDAVVTRVNPDQMDEKKGTLTVVHYSKPSVFGRRKIIEEKLIVDLRKKTILGHVYDPKQFRCHSPEIVVDRARKRIGETKFGLISNRSCHFCHWAKIEDDDLVEEESVNDRVAYLYERELSPLESFSSLQSLHVDHRPRRKHATKTLGKDWAKIRDEVKPGQLVKFKMHWRWHSAVVTEVKFHPEQKSKMFIRVVHYGERRQVTEDVYAIDLNEVDIWIYKYHPLYKYKSQDVIRRARSRIGERKYNMYAHNSSHLCKEIVEKGRDLIVNDLDDVRPGDAIIFYYWALKHAAVVTGVTPDESKANKSGTVTIIHYALQSLFDTRKISLERIPVDLNVDHIYKMNFDGCIRYPESMIIKRAKSRLGETRFWIFGNTSWDFVHWASVVQSPVVVKKVIQQNPSSRLQGETENRLLLPKIHNPTGKFQKFDVMTWTDIGLGDIVEYYYYWISHQGIVSDINEKKREIKVIHYGASHIFAVRTIVEDCLKVDLKQKSSLAVYRTDPRNCYKRHEIVARARKRLGEQDWRAGNRSWDMCLACVLKKGHTRSSSK